MEFQSSICPHFWDYRGVAHTAKPNFLLKGSSISSVKRRTHDWLRRMDWEPETRNWTGYNNNQELRRWYKNRNEGRQLIIVEKVRE